MSPIPVVSQIVEVVIFRFIRDSVEFLVLQRSPDQRVHPGMWQIVTGCVDEGETGLDAARRELREETGFEVREMWVVPGVTSFYDPMKNEVNLSPVFAVQVDPSGVVRLSSEHVGSAWLPVQVAKKRLVWPSQRAAVDLVNDYVVKGQEAAHHVVVRVP